MYNYSILYFPYFLFNTHIKCLVNGLGFHKTYEEKRKTVHVMKYKIVMSEGW